MKTRQLASVLLKGYEYKVIYDYTAKTNPFVIYKIWNESTDRGWMKRKRKVVSYNDYASCFWYLKELVFANNFERLEG